MTSRLVLRHFVAVTVFTMLGAACIDSTSESQISGETTRTSDAVEAPEAAESLERDDEAFLAEVARELQGNAVLGTYDHLEQGIHLCELFEQGAEEAAIRDIGHEAALLIDAEVASTEEVVQAVVAVGRAAGEHLCRPHGSAIMDALETSGATATAEALDRVKINRDFLEAIYFLNSPSPTDFKFIDTTDLFSPFGWLEMGYYVCDLSDRVDGETFTYGDMATDVDLVFEQRANLSLYSDIDPEDFGDELDLSATTLRVEAHDRLCPTHDELAHEWFRWGQYREGIVEALRRIAAEHPELANTPADYIVTFDDVGRSNEFVEAETELDLSPEEWFDIGASVCIDIGDEGPEGALESLRSHMTFRYEVADDDFEAIAAIAFGLTALGCPKHLESLLGVAE